MRHIDCHTSALAATAFLAGALAIAFTGCKDNDSKVPMVKAPAGVHGPTTAEVLAKTNDTPKHANPADYKEFKLLGTPIAATTPDGITWEKFPCGLCVEDLKPGSGNYPRVGQTVEVNYTGTIPGTGKVFDHSPIGKPFSFVVGKIRGEGTVIEGWQLAISNMRVGGKRKVLIPPELAYGSHGSLPVIGPNQALIFDMELVAITGDPVNLAPATGPASTQTGIPEIDNLGKTLVGPTTSP